MLNTIKNLKSQLINIKVVWLKLHTSLEMSLISATNWFS